MINDATGIYWARAGLSLFLFTSHQFKIAAELEFGHRSREFELLSVVDRGVASEGASAEQLACCRARSDNFDADVEGHGEALHLAAMGPRAD